MQVDLGEVARRLARVIRPGVENLVLYQTVDSTQECALRLMDQAEAEELNLPRTLIVALEQTGGRGRGGRAWISPPGGLAMTWVASDLDSGTIARLPMTAAAAAHETVTRLGVADAVIKWPNDIEISGGKVGGLLIHARHGDVVRAAVGFGLNLSSAPELADGARAASIADATGPGSFVDRAETAVASFVAGLEAGLQWPVETVERWRRCLRHEAGESMTVRFADGTTVRGAFVGVTDEGHLRLHVDGAEQVISAGDVVE